MMYTKTILVGILVSTAFFSLSQDAKANQSDPRLSNSITIQHKATISDVPDELIIRMVLLEYVKTDPETQETSTIEIEEIEKLTLEKLGAFGIKKADLVLSEIKDVAPLNNNMYNVQPANYTSTQKRLIQKTYTIVWRESIGKIQPMMEALRFNGINTISIRSSLSESQVKELNEELLKKLLAEAKEQAQILAETSSNKLGEIVHCNINPPGSVWGIMPDEAFTQYYYNQYNNLYGTTGELSDHTIQMSISVEFGLTKE